MHIAINDLNLAELYLVHPGAGIVNLGDRITAVGIESVVDLLAARKLARR